MHHKAGIKQTITNMRRTDSRLLKKKVVEAETVLKIPPLNNVRYVGHIQNVKGLHASFTVRRSNSIIKLNRTLKKQMSRKWEIA